MFRKHIPAYLAAAVLAFCFAACGSRDDNGTDEVCALCLAGAGGAVSCCVNVFNCEEICAVDQTIAAAQCIEGGGSWSPLAVCVEELEGETDGLPGAAPWSPGDSVTLDREVAEYVIDQLVFEELKLDPSPLLGDSSHLRELDSGYYEVAVTGELSDALGWETGDVLLSVDGYGLRGLGEFTLAYTNLADNTEFRLTVRREGDQVVLRYRVE